MRVWAVTGFQGHWPVGTAAMVVAPSLSAAKRKLGEQLKAHGLPGLQSVKNFDKDGSPKWEMVEVDLSKTHAIMLNDGDY